MNKLNYALLLAYTRAYALLHRIEVGRGTIIHPGAKVRRHDGGAIFIGDRCEIADTAMLLTYGGSIRIGNDCSVQPYSVLYGHGGLTLGDGVRVAAHCVIVPANHRFEDPAIPIFRQGLVMKGIYIDNDVWIASGARILDGVRINRGAVVASGAVVNRDVEAGDIVGGVPARRIGKRSGSA